MCTVTFMARRFGYVLGMNRDEKLTRSEALPPAKRRLRGRSVLAPAEPGGGMWIGANDTGISFALLNRSGVSARVRSHPISRGEVVKSTLALDSSASVTDALTVLPLCRVNPFRLVGIFPGKQAVVEWRWDLRQLEPIEHPWKTNIWISSGFDEPGAQQIRRKSFNDAMREESAGSRGWLRKLHRSHTPESGPYSVCMHRRDAATVSYTEIAVLRGRVRMQYVPGPSCCTAPLAERSFSLRRQCVRP